MISLNDVLLAMSNIPVDDPIAEIWGRGLQGGYKIIKYTGTLPITINANGDALLDYRIYGNTIQNGTPTPENPIMPIGCGERTENLWQKDLTKEGYYNADGSFANNINYVSSKAVDITGVSSIMQTAVSFHLAGFFHQFAYFDENLDFISIYREIQRGDGKKMISDTPPNNAKYVVSSIVANSTNIMFIKGSTAPTEYEPYGYKLPMTVQSANLFDGEMETGYYDNNGEKQSNPNWIRCKNLVSVNQNTVYHAIIDNPERISDSVVFARCYDARGEYIGTTSQTVIWYYEEYEFTTLDNTAFISFYVSNSYNGMKIEIYQGGKKAQIVPVYIGDTPLGEDEYVSFSEQKIYRDVDGTLTPTDPPVSLPEIPTIRCETVIDYDGDPKPSQMYVKYKGKSGGA